MRWPLPSSHTLLHPVSPAPPLSDGLNFDPPTWVKDNVEGASQDLIDYVFSHFTGILLAGIVYFTLYIIWCAARARWQSVMGCTWLTYA